MFRAFFRSVMRSIFFSFPCRYVIKELVHDLAVHLSSYGRTWEVWRALVKLELRR